MASTTDLSTRRNRVRVMVRILLATLDANPSNVVRVTRATAPLSIELPANVVARSRSRTAQQATA